MPRSNWTQGCQVYGWVHTIRGHRQKAGKVRPLSRHPCRTQWCASSKTPGLTLGLEGERARCGSHTCHRPWPGAWLTGQRCGRTMPGKLVTNSGRRCRYSERAKSGKMCASCDSHQRMTRQRRVLTSKRMEFNNHAMTSFPASSAITHWAQEQSGRGGRDGAYVVQTWTSLAEVAGLQPGSVPSLPAARPALSACCGTVSW